MHVNASYDYLLFNSWFKLIYFSFLLFYCECGDGDGDGVFSFLVVSIVFLLLPSTFLNPFILLFFISCDGM